jgi:catechol 2,3-dioxygenase-like lactoylglutathione lyase family enzyme
VEHLQPVADRIAEHDQVAHFALLGERAGAALDAYAAHLESKGVAVARGARALAEERKVRDLVVFSDPIGNRLEVFHGPEVASEASSRLPIGSLNTTRSRTLRSSASEAFKPGRAISGFRTGPLGMGHAVLTCERIDDVFTFYTEVLGFKLSDFILRPFKAYFFHLNPRHHSLAFIETGKNGIHHVMVELFYLDDVGQAYDLALGKPEMIGTTFGRHVNDYMTSFYSWSPSQFLFEYGWGGRSIDPETWQPHERTEGPSLWGHDRAWLPPEGRAEARAMRIQAAEENTRVPVQVIDGNHQLQPGTCAWWDLTTRRAG